MIKEEMIAGLPAMKLHEAFGLLKIDCPVETISEWALVNGISIQELEDFNRLLGKIRENLDAKRNTLLKEMSRIPQTDRKTFDNFETNRLSADNNEMIQYLKSLDFLSIGENIVIIGDPGTGKTHLAQAVGNLCVDKLIQVRYYKMSELENRINKAISDGKESSLTRNLLSVPCLIIDEVGYCKKLEQEASNVFFQILDGRYDRRKGCTIFTSNKMPSEWKDMFSDSLLAKCALDRIMDRCVAIDMRGASYRGKGKRVFKLNISNPPEILGIGK